jgi:hypothetical protein
VGLMVQREGLEGQGQPAAARIREHGIEALPVTTALLLEIVEVTLTR